MFKRLAAPESQNAGRRKHSDLIWSCTSPLRVSGLHQEASGFKFTVWKAQGESSNQTNLQGRTVSTSQEGGYITPPARSSTSLLISYRVLKIDYKHQAAVDAAPGTVVSVRPAKQTTVFVLYRHFFNWFCWFVVVVKCLLPKSSHYTHVYIFILFFYPRLQENSLAQLIIRINIHKAQPPTKCILTGSLSDLMLAKTTYQE